VSKKTIDHVEVSDQRVLMRVDFNVPLDGGRITDDRRVTQALPSIRSVVDRGGRLILMSHLGRPAGKGVEPAFSLRPVAEHLGKLLAREVRFAEDCMGEKADRLAAELKGGDVLVLENLRFHAAETLIDSAKKNSDKKPTAEQKSQIEAFARGLAKNADLYCNDAFGTCHRKHVSMYDVPMRLGPGKRVCGLLVQKELRFLGDALAHPARPFVAILGGAKVSDKIKVIESLLPKVDSILIGGAMTYTFYAAKGARVGKSLCEKDKTDLASGLLSKAGDKIHLPSDSICATELRPNVATHMVSGDIPNDAMGLDIGPATIAVFRKVIAKAKTIVWNGPIALKPSV
jgi:phosphoglycerate kinase